MLPCMKTKAAVLHNAEQPLPYANSQPMVIEEIVLDGPGEGEVLVEVKGAGLCHSDLSVINGSRPRPMPMVLGHEASGIVREVGQGVYGFAPDDHVIFTFIPSCGMCRYCAEGRPSLCEPGMDANNAGTLMNGGQRFSSNGKPYFHHCGVSGYSQFTITLPSSLVKIDKSLPFELATLFGCAVMTGTGAAINTANIRPGQSVAIFGLGGVGLAALMGAKACNAGQIIAVDVHPNRLQMAVELGADQVIRAEGGPVSEKIFSILEHGVDFAFDTSTISAVMLDAIASLAPRGTFGYAAPPDDTEGTLPLPMRPLMLGRKIVGILEGNSNPEVFIPQLVDYHMQGKFPFNRLVKFYPFDEINKAFHDSEAGTTIKPILQMAP